MMAVDEEPLAQSIFWSSEAVLTRSPRPNEVGTDYKLLAGYVRFAHIRTLQFGLIIKALK